jgi:hypothetical protein
VISKREYHKGYGSAARWEQVQQYISNDNVHKGKLKKCILKGSILLDTVQKIYIARQNNLLLLMYLRHLSDF